MAIYAVTNFAATDARFMGPALVALVFAATNLPSVSVWAAMGTQVKRLLTRPALLRAFNWTMAGLLVLTLWPVWLG